MDSLDRFISPRSRLSDSAMLNLLKKLEDGPHDILRMVIQYLQNDKRHLKVLKFAGHSFRAAVTPVLHLTLRLGFRCPENRDLDALARMEVIQQHVQRLHLYALPDPAPEEVRTPADVFAKLCCAIRGLRNLRVVQLRTILWCEQPVITLLQTLSKLPFLETLDTAEPYVTVWAGDSQYDYAEWRHERVIQQPNVCKPGNELNFPSLRHFNVVQMGLDPWQWVLQFKVTANSTSSFSGQPISGLTSLIATSVDRFQDILRLIRAHAPTLRQVAFMRDYAPSKTYSLADVQGNMIDMAQLRSFSCWIDSSPAPPKWLRECAFLLRIIHAPQLQELYCGDTLFNHSPEVLIELCNPWSTSCPSLKTILSNTQTRSYGDDRLESLNSLCKTHGIQHILTDSDTHYEYIAHCADSHPRVPRSTCKHLYFLLSQQADALLICQHSDPTTVSPVWQVRSS